MAGAHGKSLAARLSLSLLAGLAVLSAGLATGLYGYASHAMRAEFDAGLAAKARALASLVQDQGGGRVDFDFAGEFMPEFGPGQTKEYFQVWRPDGGVLERSESLGSAELPRFSGPVATPSFRTLRLPGGTEGRAVGLAFAPQLDADNDATAQTDRLPPAPEGETRLVLARDQRALNRTLSRFAALLLAAAVLFPLAASGLVMWTVRAGLEPVRGLGKRVGAIGPDNLGVRFDAAGAPAELRPIEDGLNALLDRIGAAFERERRFTADVSHELRTPLAEAMSALSVAEQWPDDLGLASHSRRQALDCLRQLQRMVATLLELSRADGAQTATGMASCDIGPLAAQVVAEQAEHAEQRGIAIDCDAPANPDEMVEADPMLVRSIFRNLIHNAASHAPGGSRVLVRVSWPAAGPRFEVVNAAPDLEPADLEAMFRPFWRKDPARTGAPSTVGWGCRSSGRSRGSWGRNGGAPAARRAACVDRRVAAGRALRRGRPGGPRGRRGGIRAPVGAVGPRTARPSIARRASGCLKVRAGTLAGVKRDAWKTRRSGSWHGCGFR